MPAANALAPRITTIACGGGLGAVTYRPAAGFDPLTATDDQLLANDFPPRPTDRASLATWLHYITSPTARQSSCAGAAGGRYSYSTDWVGLNSGNSAGAPLLQMGSESNAGSGVHNYRLWLEVYPILSKRNLVGTQVHPGDRLFMHVYANRSRVWFHMVDETVGFNHTYIYNHRLPLNPMAEWILERPSINGQVPMLAAASVRFRNSQAAGYGFTHRPVGRLPHHNYLMYTCDRRVLLARARPLSRDGKNFTVSFLNAGGGGDDTGCS